MNSSTDIVSPTIRGILSVLLLWGIYTETGKWTTITFALLIIYVEVSSYVLKRK